MSKTFYIHWDTNVQYYDNAADKSTGKPIAEIGGGMITNNPLIAIDNYANYLKEEVLKHDPWLKKVKWATKKDLDKLEAELRANPPKEIE